MASRRPFAVIVAWLALLAGAAPAWGCAATILRGGCCPEGSSLPCPEDETGPSSAEFATACCAAAPAQSAAAPQTTGRVDAGESSHDDSPDALTLVAVAAAEAEAAAQYARPFILAAASIRDAVPVYLRTSRLRL